MGQCCKARYVLYDGIQRRHKKYEEYPYLSRCPSCYVITSDVLSISSRNENSFNRFLCRTLFSGITCVETSRMVAGMRTQLAALGCSLSDQGTRPIRWVKVYVSQVVVAQPVEQSLPIHVICSLNLLRFSLNIFLTILLIVYLE